MIFWILLGVYIIAIFLAAWYDRHNFTDSSFVTTFLGSFLVVFYAVLSTIIPVGSVTHPSTNLYAIGTSQTTGGSFFLGSGTIRNKPVYYYFSKTSAGKELNHVNAEGTPIIESKGAPYIEWKCVISGGQPFVPWRGPTDCEIVSIHVPPHSVTHSFQIGLP